MPKVVKKPWGHEEIIVKNDKYVVKHLYVKAGCRLSEQYHNQKIETMMLVSGEAWVEVNHRGFYLAPMVPVFIDRKIVHRLGAGKEDALILEVSTPELDDVVRLNDDYDRVE